MSLSWNRQNATAASVAEAHARWAHAAETLTERFRGLDHLPLEDAVELALATWPAHWDREELTERLAARRGMGQPPA